MGAVRCRPGAPGPSGRVLGAALGAPPVRSPRPAGRGFCGVLGPVGPSGRRFGPSPWWAAAFALALRASPRRLRRRPSAP